MTLPFLAPLFALLEKDLSPGADDASAVNAVAWRLLRGPLLGSGHADWHLVQKSAGRWVLAQAWDCGVWLDRDVTGTNWEEIQVGGWLQGEAEWPAPLRQRADALMEHLRAAAPAEVAQLLAPSLAQQEARDRIRLVWAQGEELYDRAALLPLIGPAGDASLRAHGIRYHTVPTLLSGSKDWFAIARNDNELCGILQLQTKSWAYALAYVSVAPGFRRKGVAGRLFQAALDRCHTDGRALIRSGPGQSTPLSATLAFDRLVRADSVPHTTTRSPLLGALEKAYSSGTPSASRLVSLKRACDAILPTAAERRASRPEAEGDEASVLPRQRTAVEAFGRREASPCLRPWRP